MYIHMYEICNSTPWVSDGWAEPGSPSLSTWVIFTSLSIYRIYRYLFQRHIIFSRVAWPAKCLFERLLQGTKTTMYWAFYGGSPMVDRYSSPKFPWPGSRRKRRTDWHHRYDWRDWRWRQMSIYKWVSMVSSISKIHRIWERHISEEISRIFQISVRFLRFRRNLVVRSEQPQQHDTARAVCYWHV